MIATKLDIVNDVQIQKKGVAALKDTLGVTGTIRFLEQFDHGGSGDYTAEKYLQEEAEPTDEEIRKMFGDEEDPNGIREYKIFASST